MRTKALSCCAVILPTVLFQPCLAIDRYVSPVGGHVPPFTSWSDAATNIQDAVDAASAGDVVWVTNGVYATGGKVMAGDLTNRVAIDKALTVQSVNGWAVTTIEGARDFVNASATAAVRGVWLTNGAVLRGFTVRNGQTRSGGDAETLRSGGGIWCSSTNATVMDCVIRDNASSQSGGGCHRGRLENCLVQGNQSGNGGGVFESIVVNSAILSNSGVSGGGAFQGSLTNCTVTGNSAINSAAGTYQSRIYNCVIWGNSSPSPIVPAAGAPPAYSCLQVTISGTSNIFVDPQLASDGIHLSATSPCRGTGNSAYASGVDLDQQTWNGPPSMGCDEWRPEPIVRQPEITPYRIGSLKFNAIVAGQEPVAFWWLHDGNVLTDGPRHSDVNSSVLLLPNLRPQDAGVYQTVVSNAVGVSTSQVAQLVIRCVDANSMSPSAPHANWDSASATIQVAIDSSASGDVILVTNGIYASGGKVMSADLTNRVAVTKPLLVMSVNGPAATFIEGLRDPATTNGPSAVRAVWLADGGRIDGFTIRNGATRSSSGDGLNRQCGGGVWATGTNAVVSNCILVSNAAAILGGGMFRGWLDRSTVMSNFAGSDGGGGCSNVVTSCLILANRAGSWGGGVRGGTVLNSAIVSNSASIGGGGLYGAALVRNCTVTHNRAQGAGPAGIHSLQPVTNVIAWANSPANYTGGTFYYSCSLPLPTGSGNISSDPQLLSDGVHLSTVSPCRFAGVAPAFGTDVDGQAWTNPPSMGCDQWASEPFVTVPQLSFDTWGAVRVTATPIGASPLTFHWLKNGAPLADGANLSGATTPNLIISPIGPADIGGYQLTASNAFGVVTSSVAQLSLRFVDLNATAASSPYTNWSEAAINIQDAINVAQPGDLILVTNGIYARGGKVMSGNLTNRIAVDKAVTVMGVNGPSATIIQGEWDFANTNGPGAVRCAWLADGAALIGVTLRGGATTPGNATGGVWCNSTNARVVSCVIEACSGGAFSGTLVNCLIKNNFGLSSGAATAFSSLVNCTVTGNRVFSPAISPVSLAWTTNTILNSIIWGNKNSGSADANYTGGAGTVSYSCIKPLPAGTNNISLDPLLATDGMHLLASSPCIGAGSPAFASGVDIGNQPWANPPSMGCDEPRPELVAGQPRWTAAKGAVRLEANFTGQLPVAAWWYRNGLLATDDARHSGSAMTELAIKAFDPTDNGRYHVVLSNSLGSVTSTWTLIRARFVNAAGGTPVAPFTNWTTAATSIQDAIEISDHGDLIVVSNGLYAVGGKAIVSDLTNRVVLDKAVTVAAVNGPEFTIVQGAWDAATNGPAAERCAWVGNWATLSGFTLRGGATRASGDINTLQSGGGVWGLSSDSYLRDCVISNNAAPQFGGGVFNGALFNCTVANNVATNGGGAYRAALTQCIVRGNLGHRYGGGLNSCEAKSCLIQANQSVLQEGGGVILSRLDNCTVVENRGKGVSISFDIRNCIVWGNTPSNIGDGSSTVSFSCSTPVFNGIIPGTNNLIADPQLVDAFHLAATSPCRDAGSSLYASGKDLDDELWLTPPSMGADQFIAGALTGPLSVSIEAQPSIMVNRQLNLIGRIAGPASRIEWNFGDGPTSTNLSYTTTHAWTQPGNYVVTFRAFNDDYPLGVTTNVTIEVRPVPAPVWTSIRTYGSFNVTDVYFSTEVGVSNTIEFSTNLATPIYWMPLGGVVSTTNTMFFRDNLATNPARFYRIHAQ